MSKYNNGIGCHNGIEMSEANPSAVFVRKISPLLALGNWQAFFQGFVAYGESRQEAISNARNEADFDKADFVMVEESD